MSSVDPAPPSSHLPLFANDASASPYECTHRPSVKVSGSAQSSEHSMPGVSGGGGLGGGGGGGGGCAGEGGGGCVGGGGEGLGGGGGGGLGVGGGGGGRGGGGEGAGGGGGEGLTWSRLPQSSQSVP